MRIEGAEDRCVLGVECYLLVILTFESEYWIKGGGTGSLSELEEGFTVI